MATPYHTIINDVEAPLQKGMSAQTMARFQAKPILLEPGSRGQSSVSTEAKAPLTLLLGVTGFVLLIACANIANLLLARGGRRARARWRSACRSAPAAAQLVRQLLGESCCSRSFGGVGGAARRALDAEPDRGAAAGAGGRDDVADASTAIVMLFAAALAIGTGVLFGLFPALHSTRPDLISSLKGQSGQPSGARSAARFRHVARDGADRAVDGAAGLGGAVHASLVNVSRVDLGLQGRQRDHVPASRRRCNGYKAERRAAVRAGRGRARRAAGRHRRDRARTVPLLAGSNWGNDVAVEGFKAGPDTDIELALQRGRPGLLPDARHPAARRARLHRAPTRSAAPKVAIVNEAFAKKFNLGRDAVGKRIGNDGGRTRR